MAPSVVPVAGSGRVSLSSEAMLRALLWGLGCSRDSFGHHSLAPVVRGGHAPWSGLTDRFFELGIWKGPQHWLQFRVHEALGRPCRELIFPGVAGLRAKLAEAAVWKISHSDLPLGRPLGDLW